MPPTAASTWTSTTDRGHPVRPGGADVHRLHLRHRRKCPGVCQPKWVAAITDQAVSLGHISNLFYSQPCARLAQQLCARTGMAAAFFANSGAEANEGPHQAGPQVQL